MTFAPKDPRKYCQDCQKCRDHLNTERHPFMLAQDLKVTHFLAMPAADFIQVVVGEDAQCSRRKTGNRRGDQNEDEYPK